MKSNARQFLRWRLTGTILATTILVELATAGSAQAYNYVNINFNDSGGLYWVVNQARATFTSATTFSGGVTFCNGAAGCWQYAQQTSDSAQNFYWFYVYDWSSSGGTGGDHYHLPFEDQSIGACVVDPGDGAGAGFGRLVNGNCVAPNWSTEPRFLMADDRDAWVQTWVDNWREFKPWSVSNQSNVPIQIWVLATDGYWYHTDNVLGVTSGLSEIAEDRNVWEVDFGVASPYSGYGPLAIDNFYIIYP